MTTYKPGTVAKILLRTRDEYMVALRSGENEWSTVQRIWNDGQVEDVRPLVVLDLDEKDLRDTARLLRGIHRPVGSVLDRVADQIEKQLPKPEPVKFKTGDVLQALETKRTHGDDRVPYVVQDSQLLALDTLTGRRRWHPSAVYTREQATSEFFEKIV